MERNYLVASVSGKAGKHVQGVELDLFAAAFIGALPVRLQVCFCRANGVDLTVFETKGHV